MQNRLLKKYWLLFDEKSHYPTGVGVTAYSIRDAEQIIAERLLEGNQLPPYQIKLIAGLDELEQNHVLPNIGLITDREVWYPNVR